MTTPITALLQAWNWATAHRLAWGAIAAPAWAAITYPFVNNLPIALLCGIAFGAVSALTLPTPPKH